MKGYDNLINPLPLLVSVRQLLGYQRLEQPQMVPLINELYRTWGLLHNFFCPNLKLLSKTRKGAKTIGKYHPA